MRGESITSEVVLRVNENKFSWTLIADDNYVVIVGETCTLYHVS